MPSLVLSAVRELTHLQIKASIHSYKFTHTHTGRPFFLAFFLVYWILMNADGWVEGGTL
jgi:hypothetical protein